MVFSYENRLQHLPMGVMWDLRKTGMKDDSQVSGDGEQCHLLKWRKVQEVKGKLKIKGFT